jgi:hypothetical protein
VAHGESFATGLASSCSKSTKLHEISWSSIHRRTGSKPKPPFACTHIITSPCWCW